jgi:hypothetical protein
VQYGLQGKLFAIKQQKSKRNLYFLDYFSLIIEAGKIIACPESSLHKVLVLATQP